MNDGAPNGQNDSILRSGTRPDLPLDELSPRDFERLALHLLVRDDSYGFVQTHGLDGPDGGVDIRARLVAEHHPNADSSSRDVLVQVKRVKAFTKTLARNEVRRLAEHRAFTDVAQYLVVTSSTPSAAAILELQSGIARLGIASLEIWDRSVVTARILREPDLLSFFFGVNDQVAWTGYGEMQRVQTRLTDRLEEGRRVVLYVGATIGATLTRASQIDARVNRFFEVVRDLVELGVIWSVVSSVADLSLDLGDVVFLNTSDRPRDRALWQPGGSPCGPDGSGASHQASIDAALKAAADLPDTPVVVGVGLDDTEMLAFLSAGPLLDVNVALDGLLFIGDRDQDVDVILNLAAIVLAAAAQQLRPLRLVFAALKLDFGRPYPPREVLEGSPVEPGIVLSGCWPDSLTDALADNLESVSSLIPITGLPGTGKTAAAYYLAHKVAPNASYYLDARNGPKLISEDLRQLVAWIDRRHEDPVLIVDNGDAILQEQLTALLGRRRAGALRVIFVLTQRFRDTDLFGGEIQRPATDESKWPEYCPALGAWAEASLAGSLEADIEQAVIEARNPWHLFYLLRGGEATLGSEFHEARGTDSADIIWFAIAAGQVFLGEPTTVRGIYALLTSHHLWPFSVDAGQRGPWLIRTLSELLDRRYVVWTGKGVVCRHQLEAFGVLRISHARDPQITDTSFSEVATALFKQALSPIVMSRAVKRPARRLTKAIVYRFVGEAVEPLLTRQRELEQAVPYSEELHEHVEHVWGPLLKLVESWPPHPLYWLFNRSRFGNTFLRFSPFRGLRGLAALGNIDGTGDAVDVVLCIKAILALEGLRQAQLRWRTERTLRGGEPFVRLAMRRALAAGDNKAVEDAREALAVRSAGLAQLGKETNVEAEIIGVTPLSVRKDPELELLARTRVWLGHQEAAWSQALQNFTTEDLLVPLASVHLQSRPLLLAHVWLLAPSLAIETFDALPAKSQASVVERIHEAAHDYSPLWLEPMDGILPHFVAAIAMRRRDLDSWLQMPVAGELGRAVAAVKALDSGKSSLPQAVEDVHDGGVTIDLAALVGRERLDQLKGWERAPFVDYVNERLQLGVGPRVASFFTEEELDEVVRLVEEGAENPASEWPVGMTSKSEIEQVTKDELARLWWDIGAAWKGIVEISEDRPRRQPTRPPSSSTVAAFIEGWSERRAETEETQREGLPKDQA